MPPIVTRREGKGAGKTVLCNISDVAKHLQRSVEEIMHYFSFELGARGTFDNHRKEGFINGPHSAHSLQILLSKYIDEFVICVGCGLPETIYTTDSRYLYQDCGSCGLRSAHMEHRLADSLHKKLHKSGKSSTKAARRTKHNVSPSTNQIVGLKSNAANAQTHASAQDISSSDDEVDHGKVVVKIATSNETSQKLQEAEMMENHNAALMEALVTILDDGNFCSVLNNAEAIAFEMNSRPSILPQNKQRALVAAVELICGWKYPQYVSRLPVVLMQLYENDLIDEEFVLDVWLREDSASSTRGSVFLSLASNLLESFESEFSEENIFVKYQATRGYAEPFVTWLQEAEEQDVNESDEDIINK